MKPHSGYVCTRERNRELLIDSRAAIGWRGERSCGINAPAARRTGTSCALPQTLFERWPRWLRARGWHISRSTNAHVTIGNLRRPGSEIDGNTGRLENLPHGGVGFPTCEVLLLRNMTGTDSAPIRRPSTHGLTPVARLARLINPFATRCDLSCGYPRKRENFFTAGEFAKATPRKSDGGGKMNVRRLLGLNRRSTLRTLASSATGGNGHDSGENMWREAVITR